MERVRFEDVGIPAGDDRQRGIGVDDVWRVAAPQVERAALDDIAEQAGLSEKARLNRFEYNNTVRDLLGVAMEGRPAVHGRTRSCRQLRLLEAAGMDFGVVFTLTRGNLGDLQWAVRYAIDHDARMLTIRTADLLPRQLSTAWMVVECMRKLYRERLTIQFEDVNRYNLPREAFQLDQWHMELAQQPRGLSRVVSRLVIEADGMVVPLQPGFPRPLALGNLRERGLAEMARLWIATRAEDFCRVYQATLVAAEPGEGPLTELVQFAAAG
jgi:hypothetical protein